MERSITLLGAGTIGASWAALFLSYGAKVKVYDPDENALLNVKTYVELAWRDLAELIPDLPIVQSEVLILTQDLKRACQNTFWVQENAPDNFFYQPSNRA